MTIKFRGTTSTRKVFMGSFPCSRNASTTEFVKFVATLCNFPEWRRGYWPIPTASGRKCDGEQQQLYRCYSPVTLRACIQEVLFSNLGWCTSIFDRGNLCSFMVLRRCAQNSDIEETKTYFFLSFCNLVYHHNDHFT
jgi:hypothetical protein